jgi:hypothetical protein
MIVGTIFVLVELKLIIFLFVRKQGFLYRICMLTFEFFKHAICNLEYFVLNSFGS